MKFEIPYQNIKRIIDFYFEVEQKHYYDCKFDDCEKPNDHIFIDLNMVRNWLYISKNLRK